MGFDCDFAETPPDGLVCKICHYPARDPQQTDSCCGQTFCAACLQKYACIKSLDTNQCPYCNEVPLKYVPDIKTNRSVGDLKVFCPHKSFGCDWVGELRSLEQHIAINNKRGCPFTELQCGNGCGVVMQRRLVEEHLKSECELRKVNCEYCNTSGSYQWINGSHQEECPKLQSKEKEIRQTQDWSLQLNYFHKTCTNILPHVYVKITDFSLRARYISFKWSSQPFYTSDKGYKICLSVSPTSLSGDYVSVSAQLMSGEYDNYLQWPIKGILTMQLMNLLEDNNHAEPVDVLFDGAEDNSSCQRVVAGSVSRYGIRSDKLISHKTLNEFNVKKNKCFYKDGTLFLRVLEFVDLHQK